MSPPNLNVLTQAHTAIAAKKRAKRNQVQEVIFDDTARHDFLTGFHKRKLAKTEAAKKKALEREKQQRQEDRPKTHAQRTCRRKRRRDRKGLRCYSRNGKVYQTQATKRSKNMRMKKFLLLLL
ncbi:protein [Lentinula edodes]|uniref:Protein n=1 Tax=Lentinula edodes TaxID=5353 RepID=A0A1Q3EDZ9_LENED|nr:protein [Lentinula edodes]